MSGFKDSVQFRLCDSFFFTNYTITIISRYYIEKKYNFLLKRDSVYKILML